MFNALSLASPVGTLSVFENQGQIIAVEWGDQIEGEATDVLIEARSQLNAYFSGKLKSFTLPLDISGSAFQKSVCQLMLEIPYAETLTYGDIAKNSIPALSLWGVRVGVTQYQSSYRVTGLWEQKIK